MAKFEQIQRTKQHRSDEAAPATFPEKDERLQTDGDDGPDIGFELDANGNFWSQEFARRALALAQIEAA